MTDSEGDNAATIELPDKTYFKIGEVAKLLDLEPYVLRYWETEFDVLSPEKTESGQRVYQRDDIELLLQIQTLLYEEMFTIAGARRQIERKREGKTSYFDLEEDGKSRGGGTAVAGDEELRSELEETRRELAATENELQQTKAELEAVEGDASPEGAVEELKQRLEETEEQLDQAHEVVEKLRAERDELDAELREAKERLEQQAASDEPGRVDELRAEVERLEEELAETRKQYRALRDRTERRREKRTHLLGSLRQEVETLAGLTGSGSETRRVQ